MKRSPRCGSVCVLLLTLIACLAPLRASNVDLVHSASANNIDANSTWIDEPSANDNPNAILIATPVGSLAAKHPTGVWYEAGRGRWAIFNQDMAGMSDGATFRVTVASGSKAFVHRASAGNIAGDSTWMDHPLMNKRPSAALRVTANWNPEGAMGTYHPHRIRVAYDESRAMWVISNQDQAPMSAGAAFNVLATDTSIEEIATPPEPAAKTPEPPQAIRTPAVLIP